MWLQPWVFCAGTAQVGQGVVWYLMYSKDALSSALSSFVFRGGPHSTYSPCHVWRHRLQKANRQSSQTRRRLERFGGLVGSMDASSSSDSSSASSSAVAVAKVGVIIGFVCFFDRAAPWQKLLGQYTVLLSFSSSILCLIVTYRLTISCSNGIRRSSLGSKVTFGFRLRPDLANSSSRFLAHPGSRHLTESRSPSVMALL